MKRERRRKVNGQFLAWKTYCTLVSKTDLVVQLLESGCVLEHESKLKGETQVLETILSD